jgi:hypothetical protein
MAAATFRTACITALCALSLGGCQPAPPAEKAPEAAAAPSAPVAAPTPKAAPAPAPVAVAPVEAPPKPAPKRRAPAKKRTPKPAPVAEPAPPPPPPPPPPNPEEERARKRDAYLAALGRSTFAFNPPSPIEVGQRAAVALTVSTPPETAQLAEDLKKSLADTAWSPRLRARLAGADFAVSPAEGKDFDGMKELSTTGRTDWSWGIVAAGPGNKKLVATLAAGLPPALGGPRDLPALSRVVEVDATLAWRAKQAWEQYWQWIAGAIVLLAAIAAWARR